MDLIIFGGTGDLAYKKLYPAAYKLCSSGKLAGVLRIFGIGSSPLSDYEYRKRIADNIAADPESKRDVLKWAACIRYLQGDIAGPDIYRLLSEQISLPGEKIFYCAVMPELFEKITEGLLGAGLAANARIAAEKPLGWDLETFERISGSIAKAFPEDRIYRIDHYLGKEMTGNILVLRFANEIFEPLLSSRHVSCIKIYINETAGVLNRGRYYDRAGAVRDMLQNHILQLLCLAAMEKPASLLPEDISAEKVKVLKALRFRDKESLVIGQYEGYRDETGVREDSHTETFAALKAEISNKKWAGTNIFLQTGKMLDERTAAIEYIFRKTDEGAYGNDLEQNRLKIMIQPEEGVYVSLNVKKPGTSGGIMNAGMDYCQRCSYGINTREAYEKLLYDMMNGDRASFAGREEIRQSWVFTDEVLETADTHRRDMLQIYKRGGKGPDTGKLQK